MDDKAWANDSLRLALQQVQDVATKPLHVEIERLTREVERMTREQAGFPHLADMRQCMVDAADENERLRELLREARGEMAWRPSIKPLLARIDLALAPAVPQFDEDGIRTDDEPPEPCRDIVRAYAKVRDEIIAERMLAAARVEGKEGGK